MFVQSRHDARRHFLDVYRKYRAGLVLEPLEQLIAEAIMQHPEYHVVLDEGSDAIEGDFDVSSSAANPFLHMSLHVALSEQVGSNRPDGVARVYHELVASDGDRHGTQHRMMACMEAVLREANQSGRPPDESDYLGCLRELQIALRDR
jgi:hypothetical protein